MGDANNDGKVDVSDLGILAANYGMLGGATWEQGDFNNDGKVDVSDLGILAANYGYGTGSMLDFDQGAEALGLNVGKNQAATEPTLATSGLGCWVTGFPLLAGLSLFVLGLWGLTIMNDPSNIHWLETAESLTPNLFEQEVLPAQIVDPVCDPSGFQGWSMKPAGELSGLPARTFGKGESVILDFGNHTVGFLTLDLDFSGKAVDAPVRLKIALGEVPAEVCESFETYTGTLGRGWLQEEWITLDVLPHSVQLPRRYAFRYIRIDIIDTSSGYRVIFNRISCRTVTSADARNLSPLPAALASRWDTLDRVGIRTLQNCMQTVFEDGPKRDRRLWLGDLRLQALTNYVTFKNFDLVKRCLYLFAGLTRENGLVPACVYERPAPTCGECNILDYAVLFGPTLLDYARASGDWQTAGELWPVAKRQLDFALACVNNEGLFIDPGDWWVFIDWHDNLNRQTAMHGVLLYTLRQMVELARAIGLQGEVEPFNSHINTMTRAAKTHLFKKPFYISGPSRQISWASLAWMILADVVDPDEGAELFLALFQSDSAIRPCGPYLYHHVIEAMLKSGLKNQAFDLLEKYWGAMIQKGATTFWEVYDPNDPFLSPYKSHLVNSYCHAWSCTPAYFIRKCLPPNPSIITSNAFDIANLGIKF